MFICSPFIYAEGIKKIVLTIFMVFQRFRNKLRAGLIIKMLHATFKRVLPTEANLVFSCTSPEVTNPFTGTNTLLPHARVYLCTYIPHCSHPA